MVKACTHTHIYLMEKKGVYMAIYRYRHIHPFASLRISHIFKIEYLRHTASLIVFSYTIEQVVKAFKIVNYEL